MRKARGFRSKLKYLLAAAIFALHISPFYVLLTMCFKRASDLSSRWVFPGYVYTDNFARAFAQSGLLNAFANTAIITVCAVMLIIFVGSFAAYPLARRDTGLNRAINRLAMVIMMVPPLTILVPLYSTMAALNGISTYWGIVTLLVTFSLPLSIYLFTNFLRSIPRALDEAAAIDGCGYAGTFLLVLLPQMKPVMATVAILTGVSCWNDYSFSLYILQLPAMKTITLVVAGFFSQSSSDLNGAAAVALIAVVPVILAYLFLQKYFVQGMVDSAIK